MKIPEAMDKMVFSYAYYEMKDFSKLVPFFEALEKEDLFWIDECNKKKGLLKGTFVRDYPKGHWNHLAATPGAKQVAGGTEVKNGVLKIDAKTKSGLTALQEIIEESLSDSINFKKEEFEQVKQAISEGKKELSLQ
ncbi:MAG: hypothetical protein ABIE23_05900 [archaeon]